MWYSKEERNPLMKTFKVVKIFAKSGRRQVLRKGLNEADAQAVVRSYPDSSRSMVVYFSE